MRAYAGLSPYQYRKQVNVAMFCVVVFCTCVAWGEVVCQCASQIMRRDGDREHSAFSVFAPGDWAGTRKTGRKPEHER